MKNTAATLKSLLNGRASMVLGRVTFADESYVLSIRHSCGIGCVLPSIKAGPKGRAVSFGRFGEDGTVRHLVDHLAEWNLADGAVIALTPEAQAAYDAAVAEPSSEEQAEAEGQKWADEHENNSPRCAW